jgi:hypothetical protein
MGADVRGSHACPLGDATSPPYRSKDTGNMTPGGDDKQQVSRMALVVSCLVCHRHTKSWEASQVGRRRALDCAQIGEREVTGGSC